MLLFDASYRICLILSLLDTMNRGIFEVVSSLYNWLKPLAAVKSKSKKKTKKYSKNIINVINIYEPVRKEQSSRTGATPCSLIAFDIPFLTHSIAGKYMAL